MKQYKVIVGPKGQTAETYSVSVNAKSQKLLKLLQSKSFAKNLTLTLH